MLFSESGRTLESTIARLFRAGLLGSAAHGIQYYAQSRNLSPRTVEDVACLIRRGQFNYEGFESAASRWGVISQVPVDRLTVVTTGREGEFVTPFGIVEFVHTEAQPSDILRNTLVRPGHSLRLATKEYTVRYLIRCRRSVDLIDWSEVGNE